MIIEKISESRFSEEIFEEVTSFGTAFTDHMFVANYKNGEWSDSAIKPYGKIQFTPAMMVIHYGQAVFEGMKCFKAENDEVYLFRPEKNLERMNKSAARLDMPSIPEEIFMDGLHALINIDRQWIPNKYGTCTYLRPVLFATEEGVSARASNEYMFVILASYAPAYYTKPLKVKVATHYSRAAHGGVGAAKAAGNYAASFYPTKLANEEGYDQVIWTDDATHTFVEESGTMNIFLRIEDTLITAPVSERILDGVTRDSIIQLAKHNNINVEERKITVEEMYNAHKKGTLKEVFGVGTAVVVNNFSAIGYENEKLELPVLSEDESYGFILKKKMNEIQYAKVEDTLGWRVKVEKNREMA